MARRGFGSFADLLDGTFSLISRTWKTSLALGVVLFIPSSVLFGWAYGRFLDGLGDLGRISAGAGRQVLAPLGVAYLWIALAVLVYGVVALFVRACVTEHAARALRGEAPTTRQVAAHVIARRYAPLLGQRLLQAAIQGITLGGVALLVGVAVGIAAALKAMIVSVLLGAILALAGVGVFLWISIRYTVTLESMVVDGTGIEQSLDHSMDLVRGRWWRVFGYTLLFGLMVSFASSLVATPIMFFSTVRQFIHNLEVVLREAPGPRGFNRMLFQLFAGMGRRLGILQYVQSLAAGLVVPPFMTLLFLELKKPAPAPSGPPGEPPAEPAAETLP